MKKIRLKRMVWIVMCMLLTAFLGACGSKPDHKLGDPGTTKTPGTEKEQETGAGTETEAAAAEAVEWSDFCGEWILAGYEYGDTLEDTEPSDKNTYYLPDHQWEYSQLFIYDEDDKLYADYYVSGYQAESINGMALVEEDSASGNLPFASLKNRSDMEQTTRTVTLIGKNELRYCERYSGLECDADHMLIATYLRDGSKELEQSAEYQYLNEVTVSTVQELIEAIQNRTKIILKEGVYNFSEIDCDSIKNPNIDWIRDYEGQTEFTVRNVQNLCLEAEEGARVEISTENRYARTLAFEDSQEVTLRGLICGHEVEPGYCTGSVVSLSQCSHMAIENCDLYGCGTYGIEAYHIFGLAVADTDIYECSYGLIWLSEVENASFSNCSFLNSEEYSMFSFLACYSIQLENCKILGNLAPSEYNSFINCQDSLEVTFENCLFRENEYEVFLAEGYNPPTNTIFFENCTVEDGKKDLEYPEGITQKTYE